MKPNKQFKRLDEFLTAQGVEGADDIHIEAPKSSDDCYAIKVTVYHGPLLRSLALFWGCPYAEIPAPYVREFTAGPQWAGCDDLRELADEIAARHGDNFSVDITAAYICEVATEAPAMQELSGVCEVSFAWWGIEGAPVNPEHVDALKVAAITRADDLLRRGHRLATDEYVKVSHTVPFSPSPNRATYKGQISITYRDQ